MREGEKKKKEVASKCSVFIEVGHAMKWVISCDSPELTSPIGISIPILQMWTLKPKDTASLIGEDRVTIWIRDNGPPDVVCITLALALTRESKLDGRSWVF